MSISTLVVKDALYNFKYNVSLLPFRAELAVKSKKAYNDLLKAEKSVKKEERKVKKEQRKRDKDVFKNAADEFGTNQSKGFADSVNEKSEDPFTRMMIIEKAQKANKWIQFTLYYMSHDDAVLVKANEAEKELVNGIAAYFDFGKIYESAAIADLESFDLSSDKFDMGAKFILSIKDDIIVRTKNDCLMDKISMRKDKLNQSDQEENDSKENESEEFTKPKFIKDEDGIIHPIFFSENNNLEKPIQGEGISDDLFKKLEKSFKSILKDKTYRYELYGDTDLITLFIKRDNDIEESYIIDPGIIMGKDKIYVLSRIENDTLFVSTDHNDIIKKVLDNTFYILSSQEVQVVLNEYFRNMAIYSYIDMNKTGFLNKLSGEDFQKLGKKLTFILSKTAIQSDPNEKLPRFRFNMFESVDKFMIISDTTVKSPLKNTGETSDVIVEGLMYIVDGDNVTQKYRDSIVEFHIDKYGEM